jgi:hypothetical protein
MDLSLLTRSSGSWLHLLPTTPSDAWDALHGLEEIPGGALKARQVVRFVRGRKARTAAHFLDECAAALQFPPYFGENWDACDECLADLPWLKTDGVIVGVTDAHHLLDKGPAEDLQRLLAVLTHASQSWEPGPFHVVLQVPPAEAAALQQRWQAAGATLNRLGP